MRGTGGSDVTVVRLHATRHGWTGTVTGVLTDPRLDVPSTATAALGRLWAVNARFGDPSPATATYSARGAAAQAPLSAGRRQLLPGSGRAEQSGRCTGWRRPVARLSWER